MLARGLSVRDIEDAFKDETGRLLLSRTAVSEIGKQLWEDYPGLFTGATACSAPSISHDEAQLAAGTKYASR